MRGLKNSRSSLVARRSCCAILLFLGCLLLQGATCQEIHTLNGTWYRVNRGDSISAIAERFHVSTQQLAELNNITDPTQLKAGERLYIPRSARGVSYARAGKKSKSPGKTHVKTAGSEKIVTEPGRFIWPVEGKVSSGFGVRSGRRHDGIDISVPRGTAVKAADAGTVVFSSRLRGYGNLILIRHQDEFFTAYAHNARNLKKKGDKVKRGEVISRVGSTGRTSGPHLHFEVRRGSEARNPLFFLPKEKLVANK